MIVLTSARLLIACASIFIILAVLELRAGTKRQFFAETGCLFTVGLLAAAIRIYMPGDVAFGAGTERLTVVGLMFVAVLAGILCRHIFESPSGVSWVAVAKTLCISPLLLLPS